MGSRAVELPELRANLGYRVSSRPVWIAECDSIKNKKDLGCTREKLTVYKNQPENVKMAQQVIVLTTLRAGSFRSSSRVVL